MSALLNAAGVKRTIAAPTGVEVCQRRSVQGTLTYLLNHLSTAQNVSLPGHYRDLLASKDANGSVLLEPYGVRVLRSS